MAGTNILVVEDQRAVAGALRMRLRGLGYDVLAIAKDGPEAIEKAGELKPDLVLMDIRLGEGMDGIEAAHQIRTRFDIPVVYVSAYADRELLERARATEPAGFINKPFTTKDLLTTLNLALDRQHPSRPPIEPPVDEVPAPHDAMLTTDRDGRISFINRGAEYLTGWTRQSILGQPLARILSTLYGLGAEAAEAVVRRTLKQGATQTLPRGGAGDAPGDTLMPLRDAQGSLFGVALRFGGETVLNSMVTLERFGTAARFVFDQLPLAVALVDRNLRIEYRNALAEKLIRQTPFVDDFRGYLRAGDLHHHEVLQGLVRKAAERTGDAMLATSAMVTLRRQPEGSTGLVVVAVPVPAQRGAPSIALLLYEQPGYRELSAEVLRELYGLTRSEVNLVQSLAHGQSLEEGAQLLGISVNTARTHLKHIFHKTGAKRQSELIHLVETGPAALPLRLEARD